MMDTPGVVSKIIEFILNTEKGFINHPDDSGGPTNLGVTFNLFKKWCAFRGASEPSLDDLKALTRDEASQIYRHYFAEPLKIYAFEIHPKIALIVMDQAINGGPYGSIHRLQSVLNGEFGASLKEDGIVGAETINAALAVPEEALFESMIVRTRINYHKLVEFNPKNKTFLNGWLNRVESYRGFIA